MDLARAFVRGSEAGMVHVNNGTVSEGHMPFGGVKQSGMGAYGIGATNKEFFTNLKVVYHQHGEESRPPVRRLLAEERSEEHTSELQSRQYLVCRLLLEKKKHHTGHLSLQNYVQTI